jgi:N6-adenosine-specific RNA methylase IME4
MGGVMGSNKKYAVIYADPPWNQYGGLNMSGGYKVVDGKQVFNPVSNKSQKVPYPTLSVDQVAGINVKDITEKDAHLYMWVTNQFLFEAKKVIEAWGFKYSTTIIWEKTARAGGLGGAFTISHEFLLFCRKGSLKANTRIKGTVHKVKRPYVNGYPCHSKKPPYFRDLIDKVSPGNRIELFSREKVDGWDSWGNQTQSDIELTVPEP